MRYQITVRPEKKPHFVESDSGFGQKAITVVTDESNRIHADLHVDDWKKIQDAEPQHAFMSQKYKPKQTFVDLMREHNFHVANYGGELGTVPITCPAYDEREVVIKDLEKVVRQFLELPPEEKHLDGSPATPAPDASAEGGTPDVTAPDRATPA